MIREVFSNRNIVVISATTSLWMLVQMGWNPFWPKYMKDHLGASVTIIGMFSMIATAENLLFQLPGGMLADRYGRKNIIVFGTFLRTFSPILYLFAPSWEWIIPAAIINGAASLYMPAFNAIVADSIGEKRRGTGYGAYNTITNLPMVVSPVIGGWTMDTYGLYNGVRIFMGFQIATSLIMTGARWYLLRETVDKKPTGTRPSLIPSKQMVHELPQSIKVMVVVAIIGSFSARLVFDFINLYALDVAGLTNTQLGLLTTTVGGLSAVLALPGGMLSDRYGRKNNIMLGRTVASIGYGLISMATGFESYFIVRTFNGAGIALGGGGLETGGPSWNALIADIVPPSKRATVMGFMGTLTGLVAAPSSVIGGWLWQNVSPQTPFQLSMVVGLISAAIFWTQVQEPNQEIKQNKIN